MPVRHSARMNDAVGFADQIARANAIIERNRAGTTVRPPSPPPSHLPRVSLRRGSSTAVRIIL